MNSTITAFHGFVDRKPSRVLLAFIFWTLIAALFTTKSNLYYSFQGIPTSWLHLSIHHVAPAWAWLVFMPVVYALYNKLLRPNRSPGFIIAGLLLALPLISLSHRFLSLSADIAFRKYVWNIGGTIWQNLLKTDSIFISGVFDSALVCALILAFFYAQGLLLARGNDMKGEEELKTLTVKSDGAFLRLDLAILISVSAAGNYLKIQTQDSKPLLIRETMKSFYERLPKRDFIRINRSCIINRGFVKGLRPRYNGDYTITLIDKREVHTSRAFGKEWKRILMKRENPFLI